MRKYLEYYGAACFFSLILLFFSGGAAMALELKSRAFSSQASLPREYTCEGQDISPSLFWSGVPAQTMSLALICDDPDAPMGTWVHWVLYNIPAEAGGLAEDLPKTGVLKDGSRQGFNDSGKLGFSGPCPPPGKPHRYFFKLYALDIKLDIKGTATKEKLLAAMEGHVLAEASIIGMYER